MFPDRERRSVALLVGWSLVLAAAVLAVAGQWLLRNDLPDGYQNEFIHLFTLGEIWFRGRDVGLGEAWPFLWDEYYPPLLHAPAAIAMALFGRDRAVATLALGTWIIPLLLATAGLARAATKSAWPGAWAVALLACAPAVFGNVRRYEPNVAVAACVALGLWWLSRGGLKGTRDAVVFGAICASGLLVDRLVFAVYLGVPALLLMARYRRTRGWLIASAVALVGAGYYYARFLILHSDEITSQLGGEITADGDAGQGFSLLSLRGLLYYPLSWVDGGLGLLPSLVVISGCVLWVLRARARTDRDVVLVVESALVSGLVLFTLLGKKQPYYAIPLIAPAVVCATAGWASWLPRTVGARAAVLVALTVLGANQVVFLSTGAGVLPLQGRAAVLAGASPFPPGFLGHEYVMAGPPFEQKLHLRRAADLCRAQRPAESFGDGVTLLFSEGHAAYEGQVMPTLRLLLDTHRVPGMLMEPQAWEESQPLAHCFVYVSRDAARSWPTRSSIEPIFSQWNYDPPTPGLMSALAAAKTRAKRVGSWSSELDEHVHVYALVAPGTPAPE